MFHSETRELQCQRCGEVVRASAHVWRCLICRGPLTWHGPTTFSRASIDTHEPSLWRYAAALPVGAADAVSLGEGMSPLVQGTLDGALLHFKLDSLLPTGSFKDRGATVLLSHLRALGVERAVEDSSGNAAAAIAGYAARAGIACTVYAPAHASLGKLVQAAAYGATVERIEGTRDDVAAAAVAAAALPGATYASHNWHPFFVAGVATWAFEVWEQLGYRAPDNIVVPVGGGSMLLGAYRAFSLLRHGSEIDRLPRLFAAQALACAPIALAARDGSPEPVPVQRQPTIAEGIVIAEPVRGRELLAAVRETDGNGVTVEEDEIAVALRDLAKQGLYVEPTSAVAAAATRRLLEAGDIDPKQTTVVMLSGSGLKATEAIGGMLDALPRSP
ncbi:MAG: threonine synthase [Thermomicrobiales bacterium]